MAAGAIKKLNLGADIEAKVDAFPKFTKDITFFARMEINEIVSWVKQQPAPVVLNISEASDEEKIRFYSINGILDDQGATQIELFDDPEGVREVTHAITEKIVNEAREIFRAFINKVLSENPEILAREYNDYVALREKTFEDGHQWKNIGVPQKENSLRPRVVGLIDETRASEIGQRLVAEIMPGLQATPQLNDVVAQTRALLLAMLSNMVRGIFYDATAPEKVQTYEPRKIAVQVVNEMDA